jgi:hypothetical protein
MTLVIVAVGRNISTVVANRRYKELFGDFIKIPT